MGYLLPAEYEEYGLPADTNDGWITTASALMESYCRRPTLLANQYVERMRLTAGSQSVRLSYMPLAIVAPATSALVDVQVRYGLPRRGEQPDPVLAQIAWAFSVPGSWSELDPNSVDINEDTGELIFPRNFLGLGYNEVKVTYTAGLITIPAAVKVACAQIECEVEQDRHHADAVLQRQHHRPAGAITAAAVSRAEDRVKPWQA